mgnify:CR=1 FL=1
MKKILLLFIILILSCTKEITFEIPLSEPKITVNGFIENGHHAKILLTKSTDPFNISSDFLNPEFFNNSVINEATVVVIDKENNLFDTLQPTFGLTDTWFYNYEGNSIIGQEGKTYNLEITYNDNVLTSKTTIPFIVDEMFPEDSLRFIYKEGDTNYCYLWAHYSDPDTIGNCASIFTRVKNSTYEEDPMDINLDGDNYSAPFFKRVLDNNGNYTDEYTNGLTFTFPINNGAPEWWEDWENQEDWNENEVDSYTGPTIGFWNVNENQKVVIKVSYMDITSWNFWASMVNNNSPGIFGTPSNVQSNINGATGVWYGTSSVFDTINTSP